MTSAFFGPGAFAFLDSLQADNTRAYFQAHREDYQREILAPLQELVAIAEPRYGPGRVMRQHRDLRFSRDKTPYRTTASMTAGTIGGIYLRLSSDGVQVGGGLYEPNREQLGRAREAIAESSRAAGELAAALRALTSHGYQLAGSPLKTAPRGYSPSHPEIDLLRLRHYAALVELPTSVSVKEIQTGWERTRPLLDWIESYVGH